MKTQFYRLPIGARFNFLGHSYQKTGVTMAVDDAQAVHTFPDQDEVTTDPPVGIDPETWLLPVRAEPGSHWTEYLTRPPGQKDR